MLSECLDHATPAQVVVQVFGSHPVEPSHPFFQSRMIGVRVLDVVDAGQDPDPLTDIHRPVGHAHLPGRQGDGSLSTPVRAKDGIPGQQGFQYRFDLPMVVLRKNRIGSRSRAIPDHQNRKLLPGDPPLCGPSIPFPGPSRKPALLPLVGSQKPSLVGFDDSAFLPGFQTGGQGQEPVSPQKSGFRIDPAPPSRLPDRLPFIECLQEEQPPVLVVQSRKGRIRQRIEGAVASPAPEAREPGGLPPRPDLRMVAMGTCGRGSDKRNHLRHKILLVLMLDRSLQLMSLRRCHGVNSSKTSLEYAFLHGNHLLNQVYT